jgi:serine/threonine protein phosphatase PrpC
LNQHKVASKTDTGRVRMINEDFSCAFEPADGEVLATKGSLYIVADGMGGHRSGEVASKLAVDTILSEYYASPGTDPQDALAAAFLKANRLIFEKSNSDPDLFGMGTTCTAMVLLKDIAYFAHVGDSRAYLYRQGNLRRITRDHSLVEDMIRAGMITPEEARVHPQRNVITRSLGVQDSIVPDHPESPLSILEGDVFLMCSDGLTSLVDDNTIQLVLADNGPADACDQLVALANQRGGTDNITVQIIEIRQT